MLPCESRAVAAQRANAWPRMAPIIGQSLPMLCFQSARIYYALLCSLLNAQPSMIQQLRWRGRGISCEPLSGTQMCVALRAGQSLKMYFLETAANRASLEVAKMQQQQSDIWLELPCESCAVETPRANAWPRMAPVVGQSFPILCV